MINRRDFGKLVLGATALSFTACNSLASGLSTIPANKKRVVIVGGGFGGAATARYLRKFDWREQRVLHLSIFKCSNCWYGKNGFHKTWFIYFSKKI